MHEIGPCKGNIATLLTHETTAEKICLMHDNMMENLKTLGDAGSARFEVDEVRKDVWNCFPFVMSYCCYIPEGKNMS